MHYDTTTDLSYKEFVSLQSEHCNELSLQPFSHINKNRCEYCTESQNKYDINAVNILSTQLYYSSTDTNYNVTLYEINTSNNNSPDFVFLSNLVLVIPFKQTSIEQGEIINVPDSINDVYELEVKPDVYITVDDGINSISSTETNKLNINIYSNISDFSFDLSNLITKNKFDYLSLIDITFDATYVNQLNIYNGINITMNNIGNKYLRSLNNINININSNVFFHNGVSNNKLIKILSHKKVTHTQTITIFEDYDYDETTLYLDNSSYNDTTVINKNINKLIIVVNSNDDDDNYSIDLNKVNKLHYLKDIILIITVSGIELTITGSLSQKCNIIIFNNNDDQSSFVKDDIENYPKFYERPTLLQKNLQAPLSEIPLPLQASLLIYKFEYNANVELPIEPIFNLEYDDELPFFNQYNVEFNGTNTFLKNDNINFTIKKISFWFYLDDNTITSNFLLSLYNDDADKYLTVMIDDSTNLVLSSSNFSTLESSSISLIDSPMSNHWYYMEDLFDFTDFAYDSYITEAEKLPTITLNIGNVQSESISSNFSESIQSHCKIGNLKLYKNKNENENNFKKYLDFSESPVYQANFIQYKFNCNIEPEKNKYNEYNKYNELPTFTSVHNIQSSKFFITFTTPNTLEANINISCLSIWFKLKEVIPSSDPSSSILLCNEQQGNKLVFKIDIDSGTNTQYLTIDDYDINIALPENKWFNLVLYKNYNNNYKFYVNNVEQSEVISAYNLIDCILQFNLNSIQLETADLRLYNALLIDSNLLSGIYYDNEILKYNSLRYRFGDNSNIAENNNSSYKLSESLGNTLIYNEYCVSFKENGYLQLENSYDTKLLIISFNLNTINPNNIYHLISLSNIDNRTLEFFIKDSKLTCIEYNTTVEHIDLALGAQSLRTTNITDATWYNLMFNGTNIYIDNDNTSITYNYSLDLCNLYIGNIGNSTKLQPSLISTYEFNSSIQNLPSKRYGHTMVAMNNKIYIFGGYDGSYKNNFYQIEINTLTSTRLDIGVQGLPPGRKYHTMVDMNNKIYIFGGYDGDHLNDFYQLEINTNPLTSTPLDITGIHDWPSERYGHTMVAMNNKIYIFGGYDGSYKNNFYQIEINTLTSTRLDIGVQNLPFRRRRHTMVAMNNKIYIFGGFGSSGLLNDFYQLEINTNTLTSTPLDINVHDWPSKRTAHTMVAMNNKIYIFGGIGSDGSDLNDFYQIEINTNTLTSTRLDKNVKGWPPGSSGHTMVAMNNKIYIVGGIRSGGSHLNDFYELKHLTYDQFNGKIADLQLYNSEYSNTSIDRDEIYSNLLYYKP